VATGRAARERRVWDNANGSGDVRDVHIRDVACIEALYKFSLTYFKVPVRYLVVSVKMLMGH
jgi:hypothetical protein